MAHASPPTPVKLFVVTLHKEVTTLESAAQRMIQKWGPTDFVSEDFEFVATDYYALEMGAPLFRRFYSFEKLIDPEMLVEAKLLTNQIEDDFAVDGKRRINLDAAYVDYYKVVLASLKFGGQKLYMRKGVYGDMTLIMNKGKWENFAWGFPDFKSGAYDAVLNRIRDLYKEQIRRLPKSGA